MTEFEYKENTKFIDIFRSPKDIYFGNGTIVKRLDNQYDTDRFRQWIFLREKYILTRARKPFTFMDLVNRLYRGNTTINPTRATLHTVVGQPRVAPTIVPHQ